MARLGELLVAADLLTPEQVELALRAQVMWGARLGTNLVELGLIDLDVLTTHLGRQHNVPAAMARHFEKVDTELQLLLTAELAETYCCIPLMRTGPRRDVVVAAASPLAKKALDRIADDLAVEPEKLIVSVAAELRIRYQLERVYSITRPARFMRASGERVTFPQFETVPVPEDSAVDIVLDKLAAPETRTPSRAQTEPGAAPPPAPPATSPTSTPRPAAPASPPPTTAPAPPTAANAAPPAASSPSTTPSAAPPAPTPAPTPAQPAAGPEPATSVARASAPELRADTETDDDRAIEIALAELKSSGPYPAVPPPELDDLPADIAPEAAVPRAVEQETSSGRERRRYVRTLEQDPEKQLARIAIRRVAVTPAVGITESIAGGKTLGEATRAIRRATDRDRVAELSMDALFRFAPSCHAATLMVLRGQIATSWKGFCRSGAPHPELAVPLDQPGLVPRVAHRNLTARAPANDLGPIDQLLLVSLGHKGGELIVVPISIGGEVMCVLAMVTEVDAAANTPESIAAAAGAAFARLMRDASR